MAVAALQQRSFFCGIRNIEASYSVRIAKNGEFGYFMTY